MTLESLNAEQKQLIEEERDKFAVEFHMWMINQEIKSYSIEFQLERFKQERK